MKWSLRQTISNLRRSNESYSRREFVRIDLKRCLFVASWIEYHPLSMHNGRSWGKHRCGHLAAQVAKNIWHVNISMLVEVTHNIGRRSCWMSWWCLSCDHLDYSSSIWMMAMNPREIDTDRQEFIHPEMVIKERIHLSSYTPSDSRNFFVWCVSIGSQCSFHCLTITYYC